ncbi:hypothetical protein QUB05_20995 [Microcoleus sp. F10-C6]|uniref:hypothetical protein n=1 Tax=unclassified Microcoleus TaxID=2642155 RepID=UPI002FD01CE0
MPKVKHLVDGPGTSKLAMLLNDVTYANIGTFLGVAKAGDGANPAGTFSETSASAVKKGLIGVATISLVNAAKTKRSTRKVVCSLDKMDSVITDLPGKTIGELTISSARFSTRRRLR